MIENNDLYIYSINASVIKKYNKIKNSEIY